MDINVPPIYAIHYKPENKLYIDSMHMVPQSHSGDFFHHSNSYTFAEIFTQITK